MKLPAEYFTYRELSCRCCGQYFGDSEAVARLDRARGIAGKPFVIASASRCEKHNAAVGGAEKSLHLQGRAFDIRYGGNLSLYAVYEACRIAGFQGFGFYRGFIHVDTGWPRMWTG